MFKPSPISPISKDKWSSNNNNLYQANQQYTTYNNNANFYPNNGSQNPLSPLHKNQISPNVKMFTSNLNYKKNKQNIQQKISHNNNLQMFGKNQVGHIKVEAYKSQLIQMPSGQNNVNNALNFINLECDEVLENIDRNVGNIYVPRPNQNKSFYELNKRQNKSKLIAANDFKNQINQQKKTNIHLPEEIDLMCDETLQIRGKQKSERKDPKRYNSQIETQQYKKSPLIYKKPSNIQQKPQINKIQENSDCSINKKSGPVAIRIQRMFQQYRQTVQNLTATVDHQKKQILLLRKIIESSQKNA